MNPMMTNSAKRQDRFYKKQEEKKHEDLGRGERLQDEVEETMEI